MLLPNPVPDREPENRPLMTVQSLRLGCWRRKTERFRRRAVGAGGSSGATEPSSQRKHHATALPKTSSRNEHARSKASSRGVGVRSRREARAGFGFTASGTILCLIRTFPFTGFAKFLPNYVQNCGQRIAEGAAPYRRNIVPKSEQLGHGQQSKVIGVSKIMMIARWRKMIV